MESLVNSMKSAAISVGEMFTPVLKSSRFRETGVLTPEEFVTAGDFLVYSCPTWSWARAADTSRTRKYLPEEKQFLITRNVPCYRRCSDMEYDETQERIVYGDGVIREEGFDPLDDDDAWIDTHHNDPGQADSVDLSSVIADSFQKSSDIKKDEDSDDEGSAEDMEEFLKRGGLEELEENDVSRYVKSDEEKDIEADNSNILRTRTYDLHITYDKYYQVPRLWLAGYNEDMKPLSVDLMMQDFSQDHANKTITIEAHPHLHSAHMASIHPCRHADVMKRLITQFAESGRELEVDQYLIIFLKFLQAIIPTIEYDFTRSITL